MIHAFRGHDWQSLVPSAWAWCSGCCWQSACACPEGSAACKAEVQACWSTSRSTVTWLDPFMLPAGGIEGQGPYVPVAQLPGIDPLGVGGPPMAPRGGRGLRPPGNDKGLGWWTQQASSPLCIVH